MKPSLTLAIPYYSKPHYLRETIESVFAQSDPEWQLLVVDDCGPDAGGEDYVRSLRDSRVRYLRNEKNLGITANWNRCIELADTDLVTLLHSDDRLEPGYVELMRRSSEKYPTASAFFCQAKIINQNSAPTFSFTDWYKRLIVPSMKEAFSLQGREGFASLLNGNYIMCPTLCFRRERLRGQRFDELRITSQDFEFTVRMLLAGHEFIGLPEKAYAYRRHTENVTSKSLNDMRMVVEEADLFDLFAQWAAARGWTLEATRARKKRIVLNKILYNAGKDLLHFQFSRGGSKLVFWWNRVRAARQLIP